MATFVETFHAIITADAGVELLVEGKIFPSFVDDPDTDKPYLTYQIISNVGDLALDGPTDDQGPIRIQVDCFAVTYLLVHELAQAVRNALEDYSDTNCNIMFENAFDFDEQTQDGQGKVIRRVTMDFIARCRNALV